MMARYAYPQAPGSSMNITDLGPDDNVNELTAVFTTSFLKRGTYRVWFMP